MDPFLTAHAPQRRAFLKGLGGTALGLFATSMLGGCESLLEAIRNRPMRRRLNAVNAPVQLDVQTYRAAVAAMQALPAGDPRSWAAQAAIHGTVAGGFNLCQHGTPHFLSWHRAYLFYFEEICRNLTGVKTFALPYWNWNQDAQLHAAFLDPTSPLFHPRNSTSMAGFWPVSAASLDPILDDANFLTFSSTLEGPHGNVHVQVGQDMSTGGSAIDPVFWMHHCMIDYCWDKWNIELGNDNPNDPAWNGTAWNYFVQGDGSPANITAGITTLMPLLSYRYESSAIGTHPAQLEVVSASEFARLRARVEKGAPVELVVRQRFLLAEGSSQPIGKPFAPPSAPRAAAVTGMLTQLDPDTNAFLSVAYARFPEATDFFVRVFVNLPGANASTPTDDPHFAGSLAFFGSPGGEHEQMHGGQHLVNVTPVLRALMKRGEMTDLSAIQVQLVAVPAAGQFRRPDLVLQLSRIELLVTPVIVHAK
jgi:tyrosinase